MNNKRIAIGIAVLVVAVGIVVFALQFASPEVREAAGIAIAAMGMTLLISGFVWVMVLAVIDEYRGW